MQTPVERINGLTDVEAAAELRACCASEAWVAAISAGRPYSSLKALLDASDAAVTIMDDAALDQALSAHPRIGERRGGGDRESTWSRTEQVAALDAGADVTTRLAEGNRAYEKRFGRVFLIRAAGRTAQEMYAALQSRLANSEAAERVVVRNELAEIVRLRLIRLVTE
jgi:2-oxo-4-hydroxy-4-carboxy-5-ureidoimidazoline decarboxylase